LETFIRKNFGERYYRLSSVITVAVILLSIPLLLHGFHSAAGAVDDDLDMTTNLTQAPSYYKPYYGWFAFVGLFLIFGLIRIQEIRRNPSVYDFARFSLYSGDINPFFAKMKIGNNTVSTRLVETVLEPLGFLILGVLLYFVGQKLGILLIVSSIFYSLSYVAAYDNGDNFVMDKIDEIICNEELKKAFVDRADDSQTRGFRYVGNIPQDKAHREKVFPFMTEDDEDSAVVS
jgi:hypothetical protein